ncbi:hypothetical protein ACQKWADRAFT_281878 [Trichoderma austrokoningii]
MSFFNQLSQGLAFAQQEAARHITPENINRAAEEIRRHVDHAAQQVHQHVTPENINRAREEVQRAVGEAAERARPHVEGAVTNLVDTATHVKEWAKDEENIEAVKKGAQVAAQEAADFAKEHPGLVAGVIMMVAPGIITAPFMGVARMLGFTPSGIAAKSVASGAQSAAGNVVAKSAFATVQSAAAGGYGTSVLAGIVRVAGGYALGVDGIGRRIMNRLGGSQQDAPPTREEN